jgi:hypothetical protein
MVPYVGIYATHIFNPARIKNLDAGEDTLLECALSVLGNLDILLKYCSRKHDILSPGRLGVTSQKLKYINHANHKNYFQNHFKN